MTNLPEIKPSNEENNIETYEIEDIKQKIYTIRGKQVMLDSDIAMLYEIETKKLNQSVKRNKKRFPKEYCFQLSEIELENLRSQFVTSSLNKKQLWRKKIFTLCIYGARSSNVVCCIT